MWVLTLFSFYLPCALCDQTTLDFKGSGCYLKKKGDFFDRKLPFPGQGEMGVFGPQSPLFQEIGIRSGVGGMYMRENQIMIRERGEFSVIQMDSSAL